MSTSNRHSSAAGGLAFGSARMMSPAAATGNRVVEGQSVHLPIHAASGQGVCIEITTD